MTEKKNCDGSIDMNEWRHYKDFLNITTDSLWVTNCTVPKNSKKFVIPKRRDLPKNDSEFHGLWIPEIPYQFVTRFTKKDDVVWSVFGGSGTDYEVCKLLGRKCIINDLNPIREYIQQGDSRTFDPGEPIKLALVHPPYHDIIKYSDREEDGSNQKDILGFLKWFKQVMVNIDSHLVRNGYVVLACGNVYVNSEEIQLGLLLFQMIQCMGYTLKSHIIKDYGETKGTDGKNYNINYYRQLKSGYNNFYGDNIGILRKVRSKNKINELISEILK
jgi:DNA modification methylase